MARSINASMKPELILKFQKAVALQDEKVSHVIQECVKAYIDLVQTANGRRIKALEFKGFEENLQPVQFFPTIPERQEVKPQAGRATARSGGIALIKPRK